MNATELVHSILNGRIGAGAFCIDATAGRGRDTAYLCELVGPCGRVIAFDIQQEAVDSTNALLAARGLRAEVHLDSHSNMANYAEPETVDCIVFNLGWLPGRMFLRKEGESIHRFPAISFPYRQRNTPWTQKCIHSFHRKL